LAVSTIVAPHRFTLYPEGRLIESNAGFLRAGGPST
jgi:hypothetical protein